MYVGFVCFYVFAPGAQHGQKNMLGSPGQELCGQLGAGNHSRVLWFFTGLNLQEEGSRMVRC